MLRALKRAPTRPLHVLNIVLSRYDGTHETRRAKAARGALALWAVAVTVVVSQTMAGHLLALPRPPVWDRAVRGLVDDVAGGAAPRAWTETHVLYGDCPCSRRVVDRIVARPRAPGVVEQVALVFDATDLAARLRAAGMRVTLLDAEALQARHVEAAPLVIVTDPRGAVRYVGGYTLRKQGPALRDRDVVDDLRRGVPVTPLPVFGCAVSQRLRSATDPLGVRRPW